VIELRIVSPTGTIKLVVEWISVESPTGNFQVCPGHSPLISLIKTKGKIVYKEPNVEAVMQPVLHGIFQVADNKALVLLDA
jgi:F0F1-type ATP synthase epsilon subunit